MKEEKGRCLILEPSMGVEEREPLERNNEQTKLEQVGNNITIVYGIGEL